jgi:hypothetical protein
MCTSRPYRSDVVLAAADLAARPQEIERLNGILDEAGLGRVLGPSRASTPQLAALSVTADPLVVSETLQRAGRERGIQVPDVAADFQLRAGTFDHNPQTLDFIFAAAGKKSGHGICWEPAWKPLIAPATHPISQLPVDRRPMVALLDTGVAPHPFLPVELEPGVPLVVDAEKHDWSLEVPLLQPGSAVVGSHHGHGTFIAGLVHQAAPDAQLLSVKLMSDEGAVSEKNVVKALDWLAGKAVSGELPVDVVCLAFGGRREDASPTHEQELMNAIAKFGDHKVKFVASAGNQHCDCPNLPASLADPDDPSSSVVSVGADSARQLASYSNLGKWVTEWEPGTMQQSCIPLTPEDIVHPTGFAFWSGTSFSAANHAGRLAQKILDDAAATQPVG